MTPLVEAALLVLTAITGLVAAGYSGVVLGRVLIKTIHRGSRASCRSTDLVRADRLRFDAYQAFVQARDIRIAAESLELHLKGAAHV